MTPEKCPGRHQAPPPIPVGASLWVQGPGPDRDPTSGPGPPLPRPLGPALTAEQGGFQAAGRELPDVRQGAPPALGSP